LELGAMGSFGRWFYVGYSGVKESSKRGSPSHKPADEELASFSNSGLSSGSQGLQIYLICNFANGFLRTQQKVNLPGNHFSILIKIFDQDIVVYRSPLCK